MSERAGNRRDDSLDARLGKLREKIDRLDAEILDLLNERGRTAQEIGSLKEGEASAIYAPHRERFVLNRLRAANKGGVYPDGAVEAIFREVISATRQLEMPLTIGYLGPPATFTHQAARKQFGGSSVYKPLTTQADIFLEVERGRCHYGVAPIENSTHGVVVDTLDLFTNSGLCVCGEIELPIAQCLLSNSPLREIARVYSHQQGFAQCRAWLRANLPDAERIPLSSTSEAARKAASEDGAAAIASELAAQEYGIALLETRIEDIGNNVTRFLVVGHHSAEPTGDDKTSIFFLVRHEPGALMKVLKRFAANDVSLTMIQSRPSRSQSWEYGFFIDCLGHAAESPAREALADLRAVCQSVKVLGSYPRAK